MTEQPKMFTIFRRTCVGLLGDDGARIGTEERVAHYTLPGRDAKSATEDLIENFADDDPRLDGFTPEDDEYNSERMSALDDVAGVFSAYAGELTERPDTPPLYEEGNVGEPEHWERACKTAPVQQ